MTAGTVARQATSSRAIAAGMILVMALVLLSRITGRPELETLSWVAMVATLLACIGVMGYREIYLLSLCGVAGAAVVAMHPDPADVLAAALAQASFLMAFILLLGLLYEAAVTSPSIAAVGPYITRQPPSRRFFALFAGTGSLAVLFNAGIISFLVPLIQNGLRQEPEDPLNPVRERRQISALQRGFAWVVVWSPTALAPLMMVELIPGVDRGAWTVYGLSIFALMMTLGAIEDTVRFRGFRLRARRERLPRPTRAFVDLLLVCVCLFAISFGAMWLAGDNFVFGLMTACPIILAGWVVAQNGVSRASGWRRSMQRFRVVIEDDLPKAAPLAVTLAAAGFMGRAAAALVPRDVLTAATVHLDTVPDFVLLSAMPPALAVISLVGLSPIMMAVFLGSLFGNAQVMPVDPTLLALSISCGWALSMTFSPLATPVLLISRASGISPITLTWRWNMIFNILVAASLVPVFTCLAWLIAGGG